MKKELSICLPIWYGAKIVEVENCLDALYTAITKINKNNISKQIKFLIGIDNIPVDYDGKKINNFKEIQDRIEIFKKAINIYKNITVETFYNSFNIKISAMISLMISKTFDSNYIVFIDHDDKITKNSLNIILDSIEKYKNSELLCFRTISTNSNEKYGGQYQGITQWGVAIKHSFLEKYEINCIPFLPFFDRFFRREMDLFLLEETQQNVADDIYIHTKEQGTNNVKENQNEIIKQITFTRSFIRKYKTKIYCNIKRGYQEIFYKENLFLKSSKKDNTVENSEIFEVLNNNKIIGNIEDYKVIKNKDLIKNGFKNFLTIVKVFNNNLEEHYFCGFSTNGDIKKIFNLNSFDIKILNILFELLDDDSFKFLKVLHLFNEYRDNEKIKEILKYFKDNEFNVYFNEVENLDNNLKIILKNLSKQILEDLINIKNKNIKIAIEKNDLKLLKDNLIYEDESTILFLLNIENSNLNLEVKDILENYLFKNTYRYIITENIFLLKQIIEKYPNILNKQDENGINLSNIAVRNLTIKDYLRENTLKNFFTEDKNKIVMYLYEKNFNSFHIKDNFEKSAFEMLICSFVDKLKFNFDLDYTKIEEFNKIIKNFSLCLKDENFLIIDIIKFLYILFINNNKIIEEIKNISCKNGKDIFNKILNLQKEYIKNQLIVDNIYYLVKNKNYTLLEDILLNKNYNPSVDFGLKYNLISNKSIIYQLYITPDRINNLFKENCILYNYIISDNIFKEILEKMLLELLDFENKINIQEIFTLSTISFLKQIIDIFYNEKYNFNKEKLNINSFINSFINNSNILKTVFYYYKMNKVDDNIIKICKEVEKILLLDIYSKNKIYNFLDTLEKSGQMFYLCFKSIKK